MSEVVPADRLLEVARERAEELAAKAPHYVRMSKLLVGQSLENPLADHLQLERHGIADSMAMKDLRGGVTAFLDGREPTFEGRRSRKRQRRSSTQLEPAATRSRIQ